MYLHLISFYIIYLKFFRGGKQKRERKRREDIMRLSTLWPLEVLFQTSREYWRLREPRRDSQDTENLLRQV